MSLFIPIYIRLTPQSQPFNSTNPVLVEVEAPSEVHAPPGHYRQASEDNGGLPTLSYPLPGSSIQTPIDADALSDAENDTSVFSHNSHRPGDSIDNPIDVDALSVETSDATELITSLPASPAQIECIPNGQSQETSYECKICYHAVVDLALGCGHTYCYNCFNKFFHDSVLANARGSQASAYERLASRRCEPSCPYCKQVLPGHYMDPEDRDHLKGFYVPLRCSDPETSGCFINDYMVQGVRLKML
ncbi:hypothetical protein MPDQ_007809 [Monascus purpureus]|uniref:RING-type domain-containing protein n=1 Tax=Monascus purpureus TaxID=5098 RepID=A0A507QTH5_MONPU|nr:hypothetical protein MPDQ_007809 [Monascus purpureus]